MNYFASFSVVKTGCGVIGYCSEAFEADDIEDLAQQIKDYLEDSETKNIVFLIDSVQDENGNDVKPRVYDYI